MTPYDFIVASDHDHEKVFIEIYFEGKFVALISQENGPENLKIEFPGPDLVESLISRKIPLDTFLDLVNMASKRL